MGQREQISTSLPAAVVEAVGASLAPVDAELARRYPGEPGTRQPVHTVYVPADVFDAGTIGSWGGQALAALDEHAPDAASLARILGLSDELAGPVYERVRDKLGREPVEDLRVDFEDGYGPRPDAEEDRAAARAARLVHEAYVNGTAAPYMGIRMKCLEAAVRDRAVRTLDIFLSGLMEAGGLPPGLVLTLPKVTYPEQVAAMARLAGEFERERGLAPGRIGFEIQIETSQAILAADGTATVARMIDAAAGRATGLHYGTFDYSACVGVSAAYQSSDHPAADHAKAVMQVAAAGTGVRVSDGSTNVLPVGPAAQVHEAWKLHYGLTRRALARAYYQGWDLHPGHLPTRYAAVYAFYREGLEPAAARLAAHVVRMSRTGAGAGAGAGAGIADTADIMDEPATVRALSGYLLRGLDCGALDSDEVAGLTGLSRADLEAFAAPRHAHPTAPGR
jgi:citrate lyase beta subunit